MAKKRTFSGAIGPNMRQLAALASAAERLETSADLDLNGTRVGLSMSARHYAHGYTLVAHSVYSPPKKGNEHAFPPCPTFEQGMLDLARAWFPGKLQLDSVKVAASKCSVRGPALLEIATAAWCEALGVQPPTAEEFAGRQRAKKSGKEQLHEESLADLRGGPAGVKRWNARREKERPALGSFRKIDLAGRPLRGANLRDLDFEGANFAGADLRDALLNGTFRRANFQGANLNGANLALAKLDEANFADASLVGCNLRAIDSLRGVNFQDADLRKSDLGNTDLRGADLSGANLKGTQFHQNRYDERTRFPADFTPPKDLYWSGSGPAPAKPGAAPPSKKSKGATVDFNGFLTQLREQVDSVRLKKALAMLKADRFRLYAQADDAALVGVVKSQTDKDLVYSCRLAADGAFGCCTQNLNPCGGLRGALCKHLLVLLIGLAKGGKPDPATLHRWIEASRKKKPTLDETAMGDTLLRYKGAEAGEIDWRPTETIPEDYYAL